MYTYLAIAFFSFFFFNDTATTEIYTLSLHDALPISRAGVLPHGRAGRCSGGRGAGPRVPLRLRKTLWHAVMKSAPHPIAPACAGPIQSPTLRGPALRDPASQRPTLRLLGIGATRLPAG